MRCEDCGEPLNPNRNGVYREVTGWVRHRGPGGSNAVTFPVETGKLLCGGCMERRKLNDKYGIVPGQTSLM
jgi:hypothetical protein